MRKPIDFAFLHGGFQGSWIWEETLAALRLQTGGAFGRALTLDIPGCGTKRGRATNGIGPAEVALELIADLEESGMREIVLVAHSQAGTVVPSLAELRPGLFRRLIYVSCLLPRTGQTVLQAMEAEGQDGEERWTAEMMAATRLEGFGLEECKHLFCNDMDESEAEAFLAKLGADAWPERMYSATDWGFKTLGAVPATYVFCLRDATVTMPWQEIFAERVKATRQCRIDAGHQVQNTRPHALAEILLHEAVQ